MKNLKNLPSFINVIEPVTCSNKEHLKQYYNSVIEKGGEGLILREPHSLYKGGRSSGFRKLKPFFDTEVLVLENNYPQGLVCKQ